MNTDRRPWWTWFFDPYGRTQVWRSVETWRRRDSFLLVGLFAFMAYILGAVAFARLALGWTLGSGLLALLIAATSVVELIYVIGPTQERLTRADRLIAITVGTSLAAGVLAALVLVVQRLLA